MKKILTVLILLIGMSIISYGMGGKAPSIAKKAAYPYTADNFEDGNFNKDPEWFTFDNIIPTVVRNDNFKDGDAVVAANAGAYSLNLKGTAKDWYVGGLGVMLNIDASGYDSFDLDVYGNGENSGTLKIELYDDDNGNSDVEVDKNYTPLYDDLYSSELKVDWKGWKHVSIPLSQFKILGGGNKTWDPNLKNGSGGLVKVQLITLATTQTGVIDYNVDNIQLGVSK
ncbi:hypothetical protein HZC34_00025 [Candidatus Saganbacteria bacterium]|nr:hypothetical protein [Candidatus Saganbacteria bacterium]